MHNFRVSLSASKFIIFIVKYVAIGVVLTLFLYYPHTQSHTHREQEYTTEYCIWLLNGIKCISTCYFVICSNMIDLRGVSSPLWVFHVSHRAQHRHRFIHTLCAQDVCFHFHISNCSNALVSTFCDLCDHTSRFNSARVLLHCLHLRLYLSFSLNSTWNAVCAWIWCLTHT